MNIVSTSVWEVLTFALNGVVFVMLGTQLPLSLGDVWADEGISNIDLVIYILVITALMHGIRFVWSLVSDAIRDHRAQKKPRMRDRLRSAGIITLAGSKGTITLAIMFSLPTWVQTSTEMARFPQRDLLIFLACGVILLSLLLATFVVPLLAPRKESPSDTAERDKETRIDILRAVIEELTARQTDETRRATSQVIARYSDRIAHVKNADDIQDESINPLRMQVLRWEQEYVFDQIDNDEVPAVEGYKYLTRLARIESMLERGKHKKVRVIYAFRRLRALVRKAGRQLREKLPGDDSRVNDEKRILRDIQLRSARYIVRRLQDEMAVIDAPNEQISELIGEYQRTIRILGSTTPTITAIAQRATPDLEVTRLGLRIELEQIQIAYEEGRLSRAAAQKMRENVYLMQVDLEDYV